MMEYIQLIGEYLNGRTYVLDGISGVIRYYEHNAIYPYAHVSKSICHNPDATGRETEEYRNVERELGDDWCTNLSESDRLFEIAKELGFNFECLREYVGEV